MKIAIDDSRCYSLLIQALDNSDLPFIENSETFYLKTFDEAHSLAVRLAQNSVNPHNVVIGLYELMINGIEHGNLKIDCRQKSTLLEQGEWHNEITRRMADPEMAGRSVEVSVVCEGASRLIAIQDQGDGFEWREYLTMNPARGQDLNGRGIAITKALCLPGIEYHAPGNRVVVSL